MRIKKPPFDKRLILSAVLAALLAVLAVLELTNTTHLLHKQKVPAVIPSTPRSSSSANNQKSTGSSTAQTGSPSTPSSEKTPSYTNNGQELIAPFGNFVSNHAPGTLDYSGKPTPTAETSACNTTPGASCYIKFTYTDTGQTTQLSPQTVDANGSAIWNWDTSKDAHLTSGTWQITAVATLNGQSKTTDDPTKLTIP